MRYVYAEGDGLEKKTGVDFEWDETKRTLNLAGHKIDFFDAVMIFEAPTLDRRSDRGTEKRYLSVGRMRGRIVKKERTTRISSSDRRIGRGKTDWERVDKLTDKEIEEAIARDPDAAPALDRAWFESATLVVPEPKVQIALRVDGDLLRWYREQGPGWQTTMNAVLRSFASAQGAALGGGPLRKRSVRTPKKTAMPKKSAAPKKAARR